MMLREGEDEMCKNRERERERERGVKVIEFLSEVVNSMQR